VSELLIDYLAEQMLAIGTDTSVKRRPPDSDDAARCMLLYRHCVHARVGSHQPP